MSIECILDMRPKARKEHNCDACDLILNDLASLVDELTFSEKREIVKARRNNWKIQKGEIYVRQSNKMDGEFYTFKAILPIHEICLDHEVYGD